MPEPRYCDFCDRLENELERLPSGSPKLEIDPDGLWVCGSCRVRLASAPVGQSDVAVRIETR